MNIIQVPKYTAQQNDHLVKKTKILYTVTESKTS